MEAPKKEGSKPELKSRSSGEFCALIKSHLAKYKYDVLKEPIDGLWKRNGRKYGHILPEDKSRLNILQPFRSSFWNFIQEAGIKLHQDFHHLNSSQALCFNLFFPIKNEPRMHLAFLRLLGFDDHERIAEFEFEKVFKDVSWHNGLNENTNFDCYVKIASGKAAFFELKFSERDFARATADSRHRDKLAKIYAPRLRLILRSDFLAEATFFKHYQLFRNISYLSPDTDARLFLVFPRSNTQLAYVKDVLDSAVLPGMRAKIVLLEMGDFIDRILQCSICSESLFREHYRLFKEKYLPDFSVFAASTRPRTLK